MSVNVGKCRFFLTTRYRIDALCVSTRYRIDALCVLVSCLSVFI